MRWAAENLLARDWPLGTDSIHARAKAALNELSGALARDGRTAEAERLTGVLTASARRDLVVRLLWQGDADLDLEVAEPVGTVCSFRHRQTPGGGTLQADLAADHGSEVYVAGEAFPGEYQLTVRRIWGRPAGDKAVLEITQGRGTPAEHVRRETVTLDREKTVFFKLGQARRTSLAQVWTEDFSRPGLDANDGPHGLSPLEQLQTLAFGPDRLAVVPRGAARK
jgi:hypothetical protein